jgi:hypothetical protein
MRRCYICGRETARRLIVEPLMLPVCLDRGCQEAAAHLPSHHCSARLEDGRICGVQAAPAFQSDGRLLCIEHLQTLWGHKGAA